MSLFHEILPSFEGEDGFSFSGGHLFTNGNKAFIISQEHGTSILLSSELANNIKERSFPFGLRRKLIQRGFGKALKSRPVVQDYKESIMPYFFMIDLTRCCVLRCKYCFRSLTHEDTTISSEMLEKICEYIFEYCKKYKRQSISIQVWGGEPTLAYDKILFIDDFFSKRSIDAKICMETSGATLTQEMVQEFAKRRMGVGISIDGMPDLHNSHRPLASGKESWPNVSRGLKLLKENGYDGKFTSISVVSKESAPYIKEIVSYFWRDLQLPQFKFNVVKCHERMDEDKLGLGLKETAKFANDLFDAMVDMYRSGGTSIETNLRTKALNLIERKCSSICLSRGCMGGRKIVSFDNQGSIFTCDMTDVAENSFGNVLENRDLVEVLSSASKCHPYFHKRQEPKCQSCPWSFFCRGGCSSSVRFCKGSYEGVDEHECVINHIIYPRLIELLLTYPEIFQMMISSDVYTAQLEI